MHLVLGKYKMWDKRAVHMLRTNSDQPQKYTLHLAKSIIGSDSGDSQSTNMEDICFASCEC